MTIKGVITCRVIVMQEARFPMSYSRGADRACLKETSQ